MATNEQDKKIGKTIQTLRGDMSQDALAQRMRERGFKWSQATVWSVENGDRPLRLTEAMALADIFGLSGIDELSTTDDVIRSEVALRSDTSAKTTAIECDLAKLELSRQSIIDYVNREYASKKLTSDEKERMAYLLETLFMSRYDQLLTAIKDGSLEKYLPKESLDQLTRGLGKHETLAGKIAYAPLAEAVELCKECVFPYTIPFFREGERD